MACSSLDPQCSACTQTSGTASCSSCSSGYYPSGASCQPCSNSIYGCLVCSSDGSTCSSCDSALNVQQVSGTCVCQLGYYQNSTTQVCMACSSLDPQCSACTQTSGTASCSSCSSGYYASGASCQPCSNSIYGCLVCSSDGSTCSSCDSALNVQQVSGTCVCQSGYYQNSTTQVCMACSSLDPQCSACTQTSGTASCSSCSSGYYPSGASCQPCSNSIYGCLVCSSDGSTCSSCDSALNVQEVSGTCVCQSGYYQNSTTQVCMACSSLDPQCSACTQTSGTASCSSCSSGYYPSGASCQPCSNSIYGCLVCSSDGSTCSSCDSALNVQQVSGTCVCQSGYYQNSTTQVCMACSSLDPQCSACTQTSGTASCSSCSSGYYPSGASCQPCSNSIYGCLVCSSDGSTCSSCDSALNVQQVSGTCVCQSGYYQNSTTQVCMACSSLDPQCSACTQTSGTASCSSCSSGYYASGASCQPCSNSIYGCLVCSSDGSTCSSCDSALNVQQVSGTCVCQLGYYQNSTTQVCMACSSLDPQCSACTQTSGTASCSSCSSGYYASGASCQPCSNSIYGCLVCSSDGSTCSSCDSALNVQQVSGTCVCQLGYYQNSTTQVCMACSSLDPQCSACTQTSGTASCSSCSSGYYASGASCQPCSNSIYGCLVCSSDGSTCSSCDSALNVQQVSGTCVCQLGYYQNSTTQVCMACSSLDPQCSACTQTSGTASCSSCSSGYYASGASCQPCSNSIYGCLVCSSDGSTCSSCDSALNVQQVSGTCVCQLGYYQNSTTQVCMACSSLDPQCSACTQTSGTASCSSCSSGYYASGASCQPCSNSIYGCLVCSSDGSTCSSCDSALNVQQVSGTCVCQLGYYQNSTTQVCMACSSLDPQCSACTQTSGTASCSSCSSGYYASGASCQPCSNSIYGCQSCNSNGSICTLCDTSNHFGLSGDNCSCVPGFYFNPTLLSCHSCSLIDIMCINCNNLGTPTCTSCTTGYYPNNLNCLPCNNILPGCVDCSVNGLECYSCDTIPNLSLQNQSCQCSSGLFFNQTLSMCVGCYNIDSLCLTCGFLNGSYKCDTCSWGYYAVNQTCFFCNTSLTGCLNCSQQANQCYNCDENMNYFLNSTQCTLCSLTQCSNCSSLSTCVECNQLNGFYLNITSHLCEPCGLEGCLNCTSLYECGDCDISQNYFLNDTTNLCYPCTLEGCIQCSSNETCQLCGEGYHAKPNSEFLCDKSLGCGDVIQNLSTSLLNPSVPPVNYSLQQCEKAQQFETLANSVAYSSYGILFISIFSGKIVGLQLFGVLQMTYLNLADHNQVNLYLSPFLGWGFTNGFNFCPDDSGRIKTNSKQTRLLILSSTFFSNQQVVSDRVAKIGYSHSFLQNINVMLLILVLQFIISLTLMLISKKVVCLQKIASILFKQVFLTLFLFNCFNIAFSVGLHFKYATADNTKHYLISTIAAVSALIFCVIAILSLQILDDKQFGEYKQKFKRNWLTRAYMSISIIYRMCLGFYMAYANEQHYQTLFILAMSLAYIMYNIINLPFSQAYQNYRANICHLTQLVVLIVSNFYTAMKANQPLSEKSRMFTPAKLQIFMILFCLLISAACLIYEVYVLIKAKCSKKTKKNTQINPTQQSEQNIRKTDNTQFQMSYLQQ